MNTPNAPDIAPPTPAKYQTITEFAAESHLSASTIRRRIKDGSLPFIQLGGERTRILIPADALKAQCACPVVEVPPIVGLETDDPAAETFSDKPPTRRGPLPRWQGENST